jgi:hypothetical protein
MPYLIRKLPGSHHLFQVVNSETGMIYSKHTSFSKAKAQLRLLHAKESVA